MENKLKTVEAIVEEFERLNLPEYDDEFEEWAEGWAHEILKRHKDGITIKQLRDLVYNSELINCEELYGDRCDNCRHYLGMWHGAGKEFFATKDACIDCFFQREGNCYVLSTLKHFAFLSEKPEYNIGIAFDSWHQKLAKEMSEELPKEPPPSEKDRLNHLKKQVMKAKADAERNERNMKRKEAWMKRKTKK